MKKLIFSFLILIIMLAGVSLASKYTKYADAQSPATNLVGWFYTETIGWISLSNSNVGSGVQYGVKKNNDGTLEGWAWSDNIGWIRFNPAFSGQAGVDADTYGVKLIASTTQTGVYDIKGWARACAGSLDGVCGAPASRTDGWDGWIKFSGIWASSTNPSLTGYFGTAAVPIVGSPDLKFVGWAWGSDVVGWIDTSQGIISGSVGGGLTVNIEGRQTGVGLLSKSVNIVGTTGNVNYTWKATTDVASTTVICSLKRTDPEGTVSPIFDGLISSNAMYGSGSGSNISVTTGFTNFNYSCRTTVGTIVNSSDNFSVTVSPLGTCTFPPMTGTQNCSNHGANYSYDPTSLCCKLSNPPTTDPTPGCTLPKVQNPAQTDPALADYCICPTGTSAFGNSCRPNGSIREP
ncbi:MAG: hypothetical protein WCP15_01200 [bacterium]